MPPVSTRSIVQHIAEVTEYRTRAQAIFFYDHHAETPRFDFDERCGACSQRQKESGNSYRLWVKFHGPRTRTANRTRTVRRLPLSR